MTLACKKMSNIRYGILGYEFCCELFFVLLFVENIDFEMNFLEVNFEEVLVICMGHTADMGTKG